MNSKLSLKERLLKYLRGQKGFVASGELQRLVVKHTTYTPRTTCRRLEELAADGLLEVEYRKGHAYYKATQDPLKAMEAFWNSIPERV